MSGISGFSVRRLFFHGTRAKKSEPESATLIEAQSIHVVVRGDHPQARTVAAPSRFLHGCQQGGPDPREPAAGMQGEQLAVALDDHVSRHTDQVITRPGEEGWMAQGLNEFCPSSNAQGMVIGEKRRYC
jgi:hypothetical protein